MSHFDTEFVVTRKVKDKEPAISRCNILELGNIIRVCQQVSPNAQILVACIQDGKIVMLSAEKGLELAAEYEGYCKYCHSDWCDGYCDCE